MGKFDFDVIGSALPYLFQTGMTFTPVSYTHLTLPTTPYV